MLSYATRLFILVISFFCNFFIVPQQCKKTTLYEIYLTQDDILAIIPFFDNKRKKN